MDGSILFTEIPGGTEMAFRPTDRVFLPGEVLAISSLTLMRSGLKDRIRGLEPLTKSRTLLADEEKTSIF